VLKLIKNADIYSPEPLGIGHVLIGAERILYLGATLPDLSPSLLEDTLDLQGGPLIPGLIDCHVHVTGGGGEDGFSTQAPAVSLSQFTRHGVTSVVGLLGTDDETRSTANLLARTYALREEGLSAWCWTGGYHVPPTTLTGSVRRDIVNIDCIIGLGELAISDHRSSQPSFDELARLASEVHVAGLLARKAGVVHLHLGDGTRGLSLLGQLLDQTELPARVFHPTHVNRNKPLFDEACELGKRKVVIDVTAFPVEAGENAWSAEDAWERYHEQGGAQDGLTISSDGGGCLPVFNDNGELLHMDFATSAGLPDTLRNLQLRGHALQQVLPAMTSNVARLLKLPRKGWIGPGMDADLVCLDQQHRVRHVMARGQWMVRDQVPQVQGLFDQ